MSRQALIGSKKQLQTSIPIAGGILQRKCDKCRKKKLLLRRAAVGLGQETVPPIVHEVLRSPGQPLDVAARAFMEPRFGHDFSRVRIHSDPLAAESAGAVNALAYTVGSDVVFGQGQFRPGTIEGQISLAHELVHTIQQGFVAREIPGPIGLFDQTTPGADAEREADRISNNMIRTPLRQAVVIQTQLPALQRRPSGASGVSVRSPVFEETVTQLSDIAGANIGRPLTGDERALARGVFGQSLDYTRIRLLPLDMLRFRTVGNNIYIPQNFTIDDEWTAQTFIHELTHVWQYQHSGTSYISISLGTQIAAGIRRGNYSFAYDYQINPGQTFFDFTPEQQAFIVENYFAMFRDQEAIPLERSRGVTRNYESNHIDSTGFKRELSAADRMAEITRELPLHEPLIQQMRAALPPPDASILMLRARDVMSAPGQSFEPVPRERQLIPTRALLEVRF